MARLENVVPPLVWLALSAALVWGLDVVLDSGLDLPGTAGRLVGAAVALGGVGIMGAGIQQFHRASTSVDPHHIEKASSLVTSGVYGFTRNPMYLGMAFVLVGWGLVRGDLLALGVALVGFLAVITRLQIVPEERVLAAMFGEEFTALRRRVRRWL